MASIKQLSGDTSELICSGQVIRNLADVVKELVENSLDGEANSIDVLCRNYGLDGVEVVDNGRGIKEEDFPMISKRHFSSKIERFEDLRTIQTHGFRGEALSSICAISKVTVITKHGTASNGSKIEFDTSGRIVQISSFTRPVGTTVQIKDLFVTLPVRQRVFAENYKKDYGEMLRKISNYAIGYQGLRLVCRNQTLKKTTDDICVRQNAHIKDNIIQMFSLKLYQSLVVFRQSPVEREMADEFKLLDSDLAHQRLVKIEGFLSNREKTSGRNSNAKHFLFLNNRPIEYKKISKLISDTYKLFNGAQCPFIMLRIIVPSERIDLNLSPDKYTQNILGLESLIFAIIKQSILKMNEDCLQQVQKPVASKASSQVKENSKAVNKRTFVDESPAKSVEPSAVCTPVKVPRSNVNDRLGAHLRGFGVDISPENDGQPTGGQSRQRDSPPTRPSESGTRRALPSFQEIVRGASAGGSAKKTFRRTPKPADGLSGVRIIKHGQITNDEQTSIDRFLVRKDQSNDQLPERDPSCDNQLLERDPSCDNQLSKRDQTKQIDRPEERSDLENQSNKENDRLSDNLTSDNQGNDKEITGAQSKQHPVDESAVHGHEATSGHEATIRQLVKNSKANALAVVDDDHRVPAEANRIRVVDDTSPSATEPMDDNAKQLLAGLKVGGEVDLSDGEMSDNSIDELLASNTLIELDKEPSTQDYEGVSYTTDLSIDEIRKNFKSSYQIDQAVGGRSRFDVRRFNANQDEKAGEELYIKLEKSDYAEMKVIGQFNSGFIIAQLDSDVFIVDQHAADERYNFEKVCAELELKPQKCVKPRQLELTAHDENIIIDHRPVFERNGFRFVINEDAPIGTRIKLDSMPTAKSQVFNLDDMQEIIDSIVEMGSNLPPTYRPKNVKRLLGYQACRKSVMIGDMIDEPKMRQILGHLSTCAHPTICAHGRPVLRVLFNVNDFRFPSLTSST